MEKLVEVKNRIKAWEHQFRGQYDRLPGKDDIKNDKEIRQLYSEYKSLKSRPLQQIPNHTNSNISKSTKVEGHLKPRKDVGDGDGGELGPTPQANGKVLSIFDVRLTPPESSPLKGKQKLVHEFKTPTKKNIPEVMTDIITTKHSLTAKLQALSEENIPETPVKLQSSDMSLMTPKYMAAPGVKSTSFTPIKDNFTTPVKSHQAISFQVSPSPLKPLRFVMKLTDMANEVESYKHEEDSNENSSDENESDVNCENELKQSTFKKKNPKRTTRRWKIKPREASDTADVFKSEDVHKKIDELKDKEKAELSVYLDNNRDSDEAESGSDSDGGSDYKVESNTNSTKGKIKPMSNNYKRLKINHTNKKWKRRRR